MKNTRRIYFFVWFATIILISSFASCGSGKTNGQPEGEATSTQPLPYQIVATPTKDISLEFDVLTDQNVYNIEMLNESSLPGAYDLAWTPDGRFLAVSAAEPNPGVTFYSRGSLQVQTAFLTPPQGPIAISKGGRYIAIPSTDMNIYIWDLNNGSQVQVLKGHQSDIISIDFSPQEDSLASISNDGNLRLWYLSTGKTYQNSMLPSSSTGAAYMPAGKTVAAVELSAFTERFWDAETLTEQKVLSWPEPHPPVLSDALFTPGDKNIAWIAGNTIQMMVVSSGELGAFYDHENAVQGAAFSPDGKILAAATSGFLDGNSSNFIQFWDTEFEAPLSELDLEAKSLSLDFSPDGRLLSVISADGRIRLFGISLK
jgi:WD40 repeat protein